MRSLIFVSLLAAAGLLLAQSYRGDFSFVILGDRTGEAQPGVYEEAWRESNLEHPNFIITVGDTIEGGSDSVIDEQWQQVMRILAPYSQYRIFLTPGNHDVWSTASARAFERYSKRPLHYSFDYGDAHFTVLDNSRNDQLPAEEMTYLETDLAQHTKQPLKFVFSHRPSWILQALLGNRDSSLQRLAEKYGVQYFVAGHIHQMLHFRVNNVTYLSMASSGGHLRGSKRYESGWFFGQTLVTVHGNTAAFQIKGLARPFGEGRISQPEDWGAAGLVTATHDRSKSSN